MKNIDIAQKYFDLANSRDLNTIKEMFTESSTYSSQNTGVFLGTTNIMHMMEAFFDSFSSLYWEVLSVTEVSEGIFIFDFIFHGQKSTDEKVTIPGTEYVIIFNQKIQHIEVRNK